MVMAGGEGPDLVAGDGFLLQQGGGELGEGLPVAGEQVPGAGFGLGQQGGDSSPSTANSPRLMRWRITYGRGTAM